MTIKEHTQQQLAAQPIGYWTREAANLVIGRLRAHDRNAKVHTTMREGIDDAEYAATINTLRRLVANLGGNGDLP
ncbi:hypothetical protein ACIQZO_02270 [Streptomyces sp. NPDC097617]|uniref:hypothetical protein n=1 Tax=Streptomyces sp. NPDC097617 TaxID=3366091 RepID=UPI0038136310